MTCQRHGRTDWPQVGLPGTPLLFPGSTDPGARMWQRVMIQHKSRVLYQVSKENVRKKSFSVLANLLLSA